MEECLRLCYLAYKFSPNVGGAEKQAEKQARQLQSLGHEVVVVTLRTDKRLERSEMMNGLPVVRVGGVYTRGGELRTGKLGHLPIAVTTFLALWHLRQSYDVIHVFQFSLLAAVAVLIGMLTRKSVIINLQSAGPGETQTKQLEQGASLMVDTLTDADYLRIPSSLSWVVGGSDLTRLPQTTLGAYAILNFLRRSKAFYRVLSTRCRSYLISQGFRAEQIVHIPNGIDIEKFQPRALVDETRSERDLLCVARLEYPKGVDVLLHAWGRMMHASPEWRIHLQPKLLLAGDGIFRPQMERIVKELGIQESVEFLGLRADITDLLQKSWGFALPSRWEGMPNALLEAMACGLPCVATRVSGSEDIIEHDHNGLLVEPENPEEMALALRRILEDTDLALRLGKEGRATVVQRYQLRSIVERCVELYRNAWAHDSRSKLDIVQEMLPPAKVGKG